MPEASTTRPVETYENVMEPNVMEPLHVSDSPSGIGTTEPARVIAPELAVTAKLPDREAAERVMVTALALVEDSVPCRVAGPVRVMGPADVVRVEVAVIVVVLDTDKPPDGADDVKVPAPTDSVVKSTEPAL